MINELEKDMLYDRALKHRLIHVADTTQWDKTWLLLLLSSYLRIHDRIYD